MKQTSLGALLVAIVLATGNLAVAQLANPGFDVQNAGGGDIFGTPTGWTGQFNNTFVTVSVPPHSSPNTLKMYGPFSFGAASGTFQRLPASPGQSWQASAWSRIDSSDQLGGTNFGLVQLMFLDAGNAVLGSALESAHITAANSPVNTWNNFATPIGVAPANTVSAQIQLLHVQVSDPVAGGSIFFDDTRLANVPEPASLMLAGIAVIGGLAFWRRRR